MTIRLVSNEKIAETSSKGNQEKWLEHYVISEEENELIFSIRKRRNTLVHELLKEIGNGLDEQDIQMIVKLLKLQQRINAWRVKQIDMPIMEIKLPKEVKPDDVMGGDDAQPLNSSLSNEGLFIKVAEIHTHENEIKCSYSKGYYRLSTR